MFPLAHVGFALAGVEALRSRVRLAAAMPLPALAVGAMLPDIVDKPLGHWVLDWGTGRIFAHTLLATLVLASLAATAPHRYRGVIAALATGSAIHLILDGMWSAPHVLLWPLLGPMPRGTFDPVMWVHTILSNPLIQVTEALGAFAIAWAGLRAIRRRRVVARAQSP